ncbi:VWA domain-containing protein [Deinococcus sp. HMF7620]|uniref:VWA domain-containing protein n=1 Tax=Deinococcus arboris TaxID=2682977 RepID=A0A7C9IBN9_9DEIO|nr:MULTISPECIES: VWA domain-containing protein [Deinococcus]MBZ9752122.1 VWA domain-containing protein [Deinococcus betulae]MVN87526.1 VWA domain-containing protein [Deinococcus arboris]
MRVPQSSSSLPWPQQSRWRSFVNDLFRFYSRRSTYAVMMTTQYGTAAVDPQHQVVYLSPELLPTAPPGTVRHEPDDELGVRALLIRGLMAHEAGHVQFSLDKPAALLGQLWNALEDERMERLMALRYPELEAAFAFLGDTLAEKVSRDWTGSSLEGCLAMRFEHDRPEPKWHPAQPDEWADVWPLVQAAWTAPDSDRVVWISRCILGLLSKAEDADEQPFPLILRADGAGDQSAEPSGAGGPPGAGPAGAPADPAPPAPPASTVQADIEGPARVLASVLREQTKLARSRAHDSRGHLDFHRYLEGRQRLFRQKEVPEQARTVQVTWIVDRSGSMDHEGRMQSAVQALRMGVRAAQLAQVPTRVLAFDDQVEDVVTLRCRPEQAMTQVGQLSARGSTLLAPALKQALSTPRFPGDQHVHIVICDGGLEPSDMQACGRLIRGHPDVTVLPVLIGDATEPELLEQWRRTFGVLLAAHDHTQLAPVIRARLRALRR